DMPWVFSHQMGTKNWPEQFNSYNRLYALGVDSYTLATQLNQLILFPADGSSDSTGILYLKPTQQVARVLEWGQFKQGLAHSLGDTV
ncbi:TPA: penicillin-binding protein activator, partial [Legionella pneumophila]